MIHIETDDLTRSAVQDLLALHHRGMHENTPPGHVFALDLSGLQRPDITVFTAWRNETVLAIGALRQLDPHTGELKSMRTHPDHLRQGAAAALLDHMVATARTRGLARLSLETGRGPAFDPALALYCSRGFNPGPRFGGYEASEFNQFMHLDL